MNKIEFLEKLQSSRAEWDALVAQAQALGDDAIVSPVSSTDGGDGWSLKDLIAHNIWYEREIVRLLKTRNLSFGLSDELWAMRDHERNKVLYDMHHDLPLSTVLAEERQVYKDLIIEVRKLKDLDLNDPTRFAGMPVDWIPWKLLAENSYDHYRSHFDEFRMLLEEANKSNL